MNSKVGSAANVTECWENTSFTGSNCVQVADAGSGKVDA